MSINISLGSMYKIGGKRTLISSNAFRIASKVFLTYVTLFSRSISSKGIKLSGQSSFDLGLEIAIFIATI